MADPEPSAIDQSQQCIHATCASIKNRAVLIFGGSGSGKSALALQLMGYGAQLVSDDQVVLCAKDNKVIASAPPAIKGMIEARGVGILNADAVSSGHVVLVVDLDKTETDRLPRHRTTKIAGLSLPLVHKTDSPSFPAAVLQYLIAGRKE